MSDLQELTNELMQDEEFKKEYEALQPEMAHIMTGFMKSVKVSGRHEFFERIYKAADV